MSIFIVTILADRNTSPFDIVVPRESLFRICDILESYKGVFKYKINLDGNTLTETCIKTNFAGYDKLVSKLFP